MKRIPQPIREKILRWAAGTLFKPQEDENLEINLGGKFEQEEVFLYINGIDYYVLAQKSKGNTSVRIKLIEAFEDLPLTLPSEIPWEVYDRLERKNGKQTKWIRQSNDDGIKYVRHQ